MALLPGLIAAWPCKYVCLTQEECWSRSKGEGNSFDGSCRVYKTRLKGVQNPAEERAKLLPLIRYRQNSPRKALHSFLARVMGKSKSSTFPVFPCLLLR